MPKNTETRPEAIVAGKKRPFTGAEFLESLRDGREVYIYGERVKDVTTHPAFRNSAASVAMLYDALHAEPYKDVLTAPTDTGSGGYTHKFFKAARSREDVIAQRDAIAAWARLSYGWMGRSPDYKAAFLNTLGANAEFYGKFAGNARAWHKRGQEAVLYLNHALVNPPIDRNKPVEEVKDVYITIQKETDAGIDAIFVFDNVFVPWENVIIHRDIERLKNFYPRSGFFNGFTLQGCTRRACAVHRHRGLLDKTRVPPAWKRSAAFRHRSARSSAGGTCFGRCRTPWHSIPSHGSTGPYCLTPGHPAPIACS